MFQRSHLWHLAHTAIATSI